jgi:hypothetical protein
MKKVKRERWLLIQRNKKTQESFRESWVLIKPNGTIKIIVLKGVDSRVMELSLGKKIVNSLVYQEWGKNSAASIISDNAKLDTIISILLVFD